MESRQTYVLSFRTAYFRRRSTQGRSIGEAGESESRGLRGDRLDSLRDNLIQTSFRPLPRLGSAGHLTHWSKASGIEMCNRLSICTTSKTCWLEKGAGSFNSETTGIFFFFFFFSSPPYPPPPSPPFSPPPPPAHSSSSSSLFDPLLYFTVLLLLITILIIMIFPWCDTAERNRGPDQELSLESKVPSGFGQRLSLS